MLGSVANNILVNIMRILSIAYNRIPGGTHPKHPISGCKKFKVDRILVHGSMHYLFGIGYNVFT